MSASEDHYVLISADTHAGGSMDQYAEYLDPEYREEFAAWRNRYKNPFKDLHGHLRTRNWDNERRFAELEADGVVGEVIFPNTVPPFFPTGAVVARPPSAEELPRRLAGIRAHNRWLADFCSVAPERRAGIGQIFLNDVDEAIKDVRFIKEHGLRGGALLPGVPDDTDLKPLWDRCYDPLWSACEDLEVTITHHSGQGSPDYGKYSVAWTMWACETQWFSHRPLHHLIMGGVFERHPKLVFCMTEQGCSWIPGTLRMLDGFHAQMSKGRMGEIKFDAEDQLSIKPSEYFARNCFVGVSFPNEVEANAMKTVGIDRCMWGSDYPHHESTYPYTTEGLRLAFSDWDPADVRRVVTENAARVYGFDVDALVPVAEKTGPTVAEIATPLEEIPDDSGSPAFTSRASA